MDQTRRIMKAFPLLLLTFSLVFIPCSRAEDPPEQSDRVAEAVFKRLSQKDLLPLEKKNVIVYLGEWVQTVTLSETMRDKLVPLLIKALGEEDIQVRSQAAWALGKIKEGDLSVPALIGVLADEDFTVRHNASLSLQWIGTGGLPQLKEALGKRGDLTDAHLYLVLCGIDPTLRATYLPVFLKNLDHEFLLVRQLAIQEISKMGGEAKAAIPKLVALFKHDSKDVRNGSIKALENMGLSAASAAPDLMQVLKSDKERWVRIAAARALAGVGLEHPDTPAALSAAFEDRKKRVRFAAAQSLGKLGTPAIPTIEKALGSDRAMIREQALTAIQAMGPASKHFRDSLMKIVKEGPDLEKISAVSCFSAMGSLPPETQKELRELVADHDRFSVLKATIEQVLERLNKAPEPSS